MEVAEELKSKDINYGVIATEYPRAVFFSLHNYLTKIDGYRREAHPTIIGENCNISKMAYIADMNVTIGNNVTIEEFVSIKENTVIGDNSVIRAGTVIGGTGFEFKKNGEGTESFLVEHVGGVKIGKNVEIQHNVCLDKAIYPWDNTIVDDYSSIDNLVYIAHGVKIGKLSLVASGATIGGRCNIGDNVWIGLGAVIRNGIDLGPGSRANMGAVVTKSVGEGEAVSGNFAINHDKLVRELKRK